MKEEKYQPVYKRELKFDGKKFVMNKMTYVPVPKEFSEKLVDEMKNGGFWEDIVSIDGKDFMEEKRFNVYSKLAETLKK